MRDSNDHPKSCPKCRAALPSAATDGLCPNCLMNEALQPTQVSDASKPRHSAILTPEMLAPFFPQYEILRMLGRGGMGAVYLARQISLNRLVAIKVLPADLGESDQGFAERFKNEAQAMAQLSHPGIVAVYDFGQTTNGLLYIVMEYIEGTDVQLMLASQGRLHSAHAMAITAHVCDALQYAHSCGIIHRDIKPSNIMVGNNGVVKVADFGLAKMSQGQTTGLTQNGMAMGTPHFMAPEALTLGSAVDQRADIYAVGVMLYQMLTGKLPQGMFEMPSFQVPGLDPRYDRIVAKALRDDREQRYQAAGELRHDLDAILTQPVEKTMPEAEEVKALPPVEQRGRKKARVPGLPSPQAKSSAPAGKKPVGFIIAMLGMTAAAVATWLYFFDRNSHLKPSASTISASSSALFSPATGKSVNLLALVDVKRDAVKGDWEMTPGGLVLKADDKVKSAKVLEFGYTPPEEYDFMMEFTITGGSLNDNVNQYIAAQGRSLTWKLNTGKGYDYQFEKLSGNQSATGEASYSGQRLVPGRRYRSVVEVRKNSLRALLDDQEIVRWSGDFRRFSMEEINKLRDGRHLGIGSFARTVIFHQVEVREVQPAASMITASKEAPFVNSLGMKFLPVPITGGPTDKQRVLFSVWETRVQDYEVFAEETKHEWPKPNFGQEPSHPVVNMSWDDAQAFCRWLTERERKSGRIAATDRYRLPNDHEWSCAVGIGEREDPAKTPQQKHNQIIDLYPWGTAWPPPKGAGNYADESAKARQSNSNYRYIQGYDDGFAWTAPVGSFAANPFGLYDLGGNAHEMCEDQRHPDQPERTGRGGSYGMAEPRRLLQLSDRSNDAPEKRIMDRGFRCVLESSGPAVSLSTSLGTIKDAPFTNTLGMKFVPVPITGGPTKGERVLFSIWDTRVQDYLAFARENSKVDDRWQEQQKDGVPAGRELDHPVVGVNWEDAQAFCRWLTAKETAEEKLPPGMQYRLPSDEEWSWAVGLPSESGAVPAEKSGKNGADFPWGIGSLLTGKVANYVDDAFHAKFPKQKTGNGEAKKHHEAKDWFVGYDDGYATTSPVGSFPANAYGLYDMGGNVWQWCEDWFDGHQKERVLRGGSWACGGRLTLLSSYRKNCEPGTRGFDNGFRCVLAASAFPSLPVSKFESPASASKESPFVNSLGMKFVPVPIIGGTTNGKRVLFSVWETRVQDFGAFAKETKREWLRTDFVQGETQPAVKASWDDAQAFCAWLTEKERKEGKLSTNARYRLPTDHEWSCAAGIGEKEDAGMTPAALGKLFSDAFPWGTGWPPPTGAGNYAGEELKPAVAAGTYKSTPILAGYNDGFVETAPAGSFPANRLGLHDLGGNAWEWCEDWYDEKKIQRVQRGGSWLNGDQSQTLLATRGKMTPDTRNPNVGFRCVLELPAAEQASKSPATSSKAHVPIPLDEIATIGRGAGDDALLLRAKNPAEAEHHDPRPAGK